MRRRNGWLTDGGAVIVAVTDVFGMRLRQLHPDDIFAAAKTERAGMLRRLSSSMSTFLACGSLLRSLLN
jgi:uncharacterized protein YqfA (UPF0365 family)